MTLPDGRRPSQSFPTEKEGWAWITKTLGDADRGRSVSAANRKTGDVLCEWLDDVAARTLRHNSLYNYRRCIDYVLPWIGDIKVKHLKRPDIEKTFAGLARGDGNTCPLQGNTLNLTFRVLKMALDYCEDVEYIGHNPMTRMKAPPMPEAKTRVLSHEDLERVLEMAHGTRWEAAYWLHVTTGMRVSEILGLLWADIDLNTGCITVARQTGREYGCSGVKLLPLKTHAARRDVMVPPVVCQVLRWHRDQQIIEQRQAERGDAWEEHGAVFCTPMGKLYFRSQLADDFRRITRQLEIEGATLHTFRHTFATMIQEGGEPIKTAQTMLGHATERTTMQIYSHPTSAGLQRVAHMMQGMFGASETAEPTETLTVEEDGWNTDRGQTRGQRPVSAV